MGWYTLLLRSSFPRMSFLRDPGTQVVPIVHGQLISRRTLGVGKRCLGSDKRDSPVCRLYLRRK